MNMYLTFAQCLDQLMQVHQFNVSALGNQIGCKAELRRALSDELSDGKRQQLFERISQSKVFSKEELERLQLSLQVSKIGSDKYAARSSIAAMLESPKREQSQPIRLMDGGTLNDRIDEIIDAESINILCINCCYNSVIDSLKSLFSLKKSNLKMRHYARLDSCSYAPSEFIACASPVLFDSRYIPIGFSGKSSAGYAINGNYLSITATIGRRHIEQFYVITTEDTAYEMHTAAKAGLYTFLNRIISDISPVPIPLKEPQNETDDYFHFVMLLLSRELNRTTYFFGSDMKFQQTPPEIASCALRDQSVFTKEMIENIDARIMPLHHQRYTNFYNKKKPSYLLLSYKGCKRFLEIGKSGDHFFGFRPFTLKERNSIFNNMLKAAHQNHYFTPLLLKDDDFSSKFIINCYDKLGISLTKRNNDYNLMHEFSQIFLPYPEFTKQCIEYLQSVFIPEHCRSKEESLSLLDELYDQYK